MKNLAILCSVSRPAISSVRACIAIACAITASMTAFGDDSAEPRMTTIELGGHSSRQPIFISQLPTEEVIVEELPVEDDRELENCKPFTTDPLASLTVDIAPVDRLGRAKLSAARPKDCASYALGEPQTLFFVPSYNDGLRYPCAGWQFCHRPLYFEERCLERYGCRSCCCQPFASGVHFYSSALLLPIKLCRMPPCSTCVRTPCY